MQIVMMLSLGSGLTYTLGRMTGSQRHGWAVWAAMALLCLAGVTVIYAMESRGNPLLHGIDQRTSAVQPGGNMEGKEVRFGIAANRAFRHHDDGRELRRRQRHARFVHSAWRYGSAGQHHDWRGHFRRCWRGPLWHRRFHYPVGFHRRIDGGPDAGVSG